MTFSPPFFSTEILTQITASGYTTPTPIQLQAIPPILNGSDVIGLAQTGTGKTAAFVLPILQRLSTGKHGLLRAIIVAPTRELAEQINDTIRILGKRTGLKSTTIYGGVNMKRQVDILRSGIDIVVACPGRVLDHIKQRTINLATTEILVLDEADQMFDMGFLPTIKEILKHVPQRRQTLLFSATMPPEIRKLAAAILKAPVTVEVAHTLAKESISHTFFPVISPLKTELLLALLESTETRSVLIFTRTKHKAKALDQKLQKRGYKSASLQGNLSQNRRQAALNGFRDGEFNIMVATDIAARGIDISKVSHVINFDLPDTFEAYVHRSGRTGRAEHNGESFSLVTPEDKEIQSIIQRKLGAEIATRYLDTFDYDRPFAAPTSKPKNRPRRS